MKPICEGRQNWILIRKALLITFKGGFSIEDLVKAAIISLA